MRYWREYSGTLQPDATVTINSDTQPDNWFVQINSSYTGAVYVTTNPLASMGMALYAGDNITIPALNNTITLISRVANSEVVEYTVVAYAGVNFSFARTAIPGGSVTDKIICRLYQPSYSSGSGTSVVPWQTVEYDNAGLFSPATNTLITLKEPGLWHIHCMHLLNTNPVYNGTVGFTLLLNGSVYGPDYRYSVTTSTTAGYGYASSIYYINSSTTDYIQVRFVQSSANMANYRWYLTATRISRV